MFLRLGAGVGHYGGRGTPAPPWFIVYSQSRAYVLCFVWVLCVCCSGNYFHVAKTVRRQNLYSISPRRSGLGTEPSRPTLIARRE